MQRFLHAAKAVGQQRLHHQQGQVDAQGQQAGAEHCIQDGIGRQIHHRRAQTVHQRTGQQLFLQLFRGRVLAVQGEQTAQQAGQHAGGHQQQRDRSRQHHTVMGGGGQHHQRGQTHALHDHGVVQEHAVVVGKAVGVLQNQFCGRFSHSAASFPAPDAGRWCSRRYSRTSVRSIHAEMLLTASTAKHTPVSYTP